MIRLIELIYSLFKILPDEDSDIWEDAAQARQVADKINEIKEYIQSYLLYKQ